ncbi:cellular tumor antigen p53-like isoform X1 [Rhopalosiphum maidis]|uniref:cellular tumor antigen p53-like isoform X1 n=3 Tax=Rhopalosiphum maidis TaxID=43146 RepID=UPI000EFFD2BB|nr:cellular tumor antigen p53-like isoform X1 [Rhopalosiphum maidis]
MMDDTKFPDLSEMQNSNEEIFNFNTCKDSLTPSLLQQQFDGVYINQNDINEYYFSMENGRIVDLNLPQTPEEDRENHETCAAGSVKSSPTGIIPCQDEFGGSLNFEVLLDSSFQSYRQKWIYSVKLQKLFIDINKVLLLNFKCDFEKIANNTLLFVRAMPMYSSADYLKEPVDRCLQHLSPIDQFNKGITHLEHVIRCDNESTTYHIDEVSKRKSVVTLLSRPEHESDSTRLSYRFVCKTSCISGMQRRPIIVIFTLEDYTGQVLGRRVLPVKICSCPKRDMVREEEDTHLKKNTVFRRTKRCISQEINHHKNHHHHHSEHEIPPAKIIKLESSTSAENITENTYTLPINYTTKIKEHYKIILENIYSVISGASSLHNITDTQPLLKDLKSRLDNLK